MSHKQQFTAHEHEQPDSWHRHIVEDEGAPQEEHGRTNPAALMIAIIACIVFVGGTILASYLYFNVYFTSLRREKIESDTLARGFFDVKENGPREDGSPSRDGVRALELARLGDYSFATDDLGRKGVAAVPIEKAMQNVIDRYGKK